MMAGPLTKRIARITIGLMFVGMGGLGLAERYTFTRGDAAEIAPLLVSVAALVVGVLVLAREPLRRNEEQPDTENEE